MKRLAVFFFAAALAFAQESHNTNATSLQGKQLKYTAAPGDQCVLTWVAANLRYECLSATGGGAGNPAGADKQVQFNDGGIFGATSGFLWNKATQELSFGASPSEAALRMPSLGSSRWSWRSTSSVFAGVRDNLFRLCWNEASEDLTEPQFCLGQLEQNFRDVTAPASNTVELHLGAYTAANGTSRRPIQINIFRQDNADASWLANQVQVHYSGNHYFHSSDSVTGLLSVLGDTQQILVSNGTYLASSTNGAAWLKQARVNGTYSNLAWLDGGNVWRLSPDGEPVVTPSLVRVGSLTNASDYLLKVDPADKSVRIGSGQAGEKGLFVRGPDTTGQTITITDGTFTYKMRRNASTGALEFVGDQSGVVAYTFDAGVTASSYAGSAAGLTSIPAAQLTGSVADARLSSNVPLKNADNTLTGVQTLNDNGVNAKLKLSHATDANGFGSQIVYSGGGTDRFLTGSARAAGAYSYGVQNPNTGTYAYAVPYNNFHLVVSDNPTDNASGAKLQVDGGLQLVTSTRPSCAAALRGSMWYVAGGAGVADTVAVCSKGAADTYSWVAWGVPIV